MKVKAYRESLMDEGRRCSRLIWFVGEL